MKNLFAFWCKHYTQSRRILQFSMVFLCTAPILAQKIEKDTLQPQQLDEVLLSAVRANNQTPVTFSNSTKKEFQSRNLGQDIPMLLNFLPSVVTTTDAGAGVGYTGIRVRGSDATRVNVTINGVPYNDSESQGTFWVNMPDFASSTESIQLQRGVGTSTNGSSAFGASLNVMTDTFSKEASAELANAFGSFNTRKHTVKFSSGLLNDKFELAGRLSQIKSEGYIDRAFSDLKSYFLQGTYIHGTTLIKALVFGGDQVTYQAWNGLEDPEKLQNDRTYNTAGEIYDSAGNVVGFYDNETDNYKQDHYQLHWNEKWTGKWSTNLAFHYTIGKGYFENYKGAQDIADYGMNPVTINGNTITETDIIRQKWLKNDFYGAVFSLNYKNEAWNVILGGGTHRYEGSHFGNILWTKDIPLGMYGQKYYDDFSTKNDLNVYAKANYQWAKKWNVFGDLQLRNVTYTANGQETGIVDDSFQFFNPKAGITFMLNDNNNLYASYAKAHREPNRDDYENGSPKPEKLDDYELGWRFATSKVKININGYFMNYKNQLVLTGGLNDVGAPIRANVGDSYRLGLEIDAWMQLLEKWTLQPNVAVSRNRNKNFYFQRDGVLQNLNDTHIAFSPDVVFANRLSFMPFKGFQTSLFTKYVGSQFMGNIDSPNSKLAAYTTTDFNVSYEFLPKSIFKSVLIAVLVNNIFDETYESNGYFYTYDDSWSNPGAINTIEGAGYYPQAGINILAGITLKF